MLKENCERKFLQLSHCVKWMLSEWSIFKLKSYWHWKKRGSITIHRQWREKQNHILDLQLLVTEKRRPKTTLFVGMLRFHAKIRKFLQIFTEQTISRKIKIMICSTISRKFHMEHFVKQHRTIRKLLLKSCERTIKRRPLCTIYK